MARRKFSIGGVKVVFQRSSNLTKLVVLIAVALSIVTLMMLATTIVARQELAAEQRQQAIALEQENAKLAAQIAELGSVQSVLRIAREKLGYEDPDAIIFETVDPTEAQ